VCPRAGLDAVVKREIVSPCRDSNPRSSSLQPKAIALSYPDSYKGSFTFTFMPEKDLNPGAGFQSKNDFNQSWKKICMVISFPLFVFLLMMYLKFCSDCVKKFLEVGWRLKSDVIDCAWFFLA
jgi:hypothetical protein